MEVTSKLSNVLRPKFNGNQDLPEAEQVEVHITYPTSEEYDRLSAGHGAAINLVRECVHEGAVKKLRHNGVTITSGKLLVGQVRGVLTDLIVEIYTDIVKANRTTEEESKNSDGQSSSS